MKKIDYHAQAELYLGRDWETAAAQGSRTFGTAAKAIRFAVEEAAPVSLHGARLEVAGKVFSGAQLTSLYQSRTFPLPRKRSSPLPPSLSITEDLTMEKFNYDAAAELYPSRRYAKSQQARYRRFARAADAIRYVIEEMPDKWLTGTFLEVDEQRLEGAAIRPLYEAPEYPLPRRKLAA